MEKYNTNQTGYIPKSSDSPSKPMSEVERGVDSLSGKNIVLDELIASLRNRLSPILVQTPIDALDKPVAGNSYSTELGQALGTINISYGENLDALRDLISRIDL